MPSHRVREGCVEQIIILRREHLDDGCKTVPLVAIQISETFQMGFWK
jgi:hypothetical protein